MAINLLGLLKDQLGDNIIGQAANLIGENKTATNSAIGAMLPTILGSIVQKGSTSSGAGSLLNMINDGNHDGSMFDNLSGMLSNGSSSSSLMNIGKTLLPSIMGTRQNSIMDLLGKVTGFGRNSNSSLMSMLAPMVLGMIGRQVKNKGLNASGLMDLLKGQQSHLSSALPAGMGSILGFANNSNDYTSKKTTTSTSTKTTHTPEPSGGGGGWMKWLVPLLLALGLLGYFGLKTGSDTLDNAASTVSDTATGAASTVADAAGDVANATGDAVSSAAKHTTDAAGNLVDAAGNVVAKAGDLTKDAAGNLVDKAGNIVSKAGDAAGNAMDAAGNAAGAAKDAVAGTVDVPNVTFTVDADGNLVDENGKIAYKAGEFSKSEEGYYVDKNGKKIGFFKKVGQAIAGAAGKTADFFSNTFGNMFKKKEAKGQSYTLSDIEWNPENHRITNFSKAEVEGLAAALKANPDAKIQVQAFTDDGGNKLKNKTISTARAKVVHDMLVSLGVAKGQISSKGMSAKDEAKAAADKIEIIVE